MGRFASFREFYPFYLSEHANSMSRRLHFIGSCGVLVLIAVAIVRGNAERKMRSLNIRRVFPILWIGKRYAGCLLR
jgi:hypothetical protein